MDKKDEEDLMKIQLEKQAESRKQRSTALFYDESYWGEYWTKRFNAFPQEADPVSKAEVEKKVTYIEQYFPMAKSMLDVACSFGFLTAALYDKGWNAWGVDISKAALQHAPIRVKDKIVEGSATNMFMFQENQFQLVTAFDILEHLYIEEIYVAIAEISRVASEGVLIRLPVPSYNAEPWVADLSHQGLTREHVSMYPWEFWARRFHEKGKFKWWHTNIWTQGEPEVAEGWIYFKRA